MSSPEDTKMEGNNSEIEETEDTKKKSSRSKDKKSSRDKEKHTNSSKKSHKKSRKKDKDKSSDDKKGEKDKESSSKKSSSSSKSSKSSKSKRDRDKDSKSSSKSSKKDKDKEKDKEKDSKSSKSSKSKDKKRKRSISPSSRSRSRSKSRDRDRKRRRSSGSHSPHSRHRYSRSSHNSRIRSYSRSPSPYHSHRRDRERERERERDRHRRDHRDRSRDRDRRRRRYKRSRRYESRSRSRSRSNSSSVSSNKSNSKKEIDTTLDITNPNGSKMAEIKATAPNAMQQISDPSQANRVLSQSNPLAAFNSVFGNLSRPAVLALTNPVQQNNMILQQLLCGNNPYKTSLGISGLTNNMNPLLMNKIAMELQKTTVQQQTATAAATVNAAKCAAAAAAINNNNNNDLDNDANNNNDIDVNNNNEVNVVGDNNKGDVDDNGDSLFFTVHLPGMNTLTAIGGIHPQITRPARRLYVGNLPVGMGLNEQILCEFFSQCCRGLGIATPNPVLSVWLNSEQTFGFIEFRSVQDTNLALQLFEGLQLGGRQLRFGRPVDYKEPPDNLKKYIVGENKNNNNNNNNNNNKNNDIEQGSPAAMLLAQQEQQNNILNNTLNIQQQEAAKKTLDLAILNKQKAMLQAMANNVNKIGNNGANNKLIVNNNGDIEMKERGQEIESNVLLLINMLNKDDINDDEEYDDIVDDIQCECENYGNLLNVVVPRIGEKGCCRVFLRFETISGAKKCKSKVDGRKFGNNIVKCLYFKEKLFNDKQYDHKID